MLQIPERSALRLRPLFSERLVMQPLDGSASREMNEAVNASLSELGPWLPWVPFAKDPEGTFNYVEGSASDWDAHRACRFSIRDRGSHLFLGVVGIEAWNHLHDNGELGYWIRSDATRLGYTSEAARCVLDFAFDTVGAHRIRTAAATDNHASLGVIRRLGFHFEGIAREAERVDGRWVSHAVYAKLSSDPRR